MTAADVAAWTALLVGAGILVAAHHDPVVHMAQHLVVGMYAPVALVLAAPVSLLRGRPPRGPAGW